MTGPRRRRTDRQGWSAKIWAIYDEWGAIIQFGFGIVLLVVAFAVLTLGIMDWNQRTTSERISREACVRSQRLGPLNLQEHRLLGVYSTDDLLYFRETVPKDCD